MPWPTVALHRRRRTREPRRRRPAQAISARSAASRCFATPSTRLAGHAGDRRGAGRDRRRPGGALSRGGGRSRPLPDPVTGGAERHDLGRATGSRRSPARPGPHPRRRPALLPAGGRRPAARRARRPRRRGPGPSGRRHAGARRTRRSASRSTATGAGPGADPAGLRLRRDPRRPPGLARRRRPPTTPRSPAPPASRSPLVAGDEALAQAHLGEDFARGRAAARGAA